MPEWKTCPDSLLVQYLKRPGAPADKFRSRLPTIRGYVAMSDRWADERRLDRGIVAGMIRVESNWNPNAISPAGAQGMMQLMPKTAARRAEQLGIQNLVFNPETNIRMGTYGLRSYLDYWRKHRADYPAAMPFSNWHLALASYNWGVGNVQKRMASGPTATLPPKVQRYIEFVQRAGEAYHTLVDRCRGASGEVTPPGPQPSPSPLPPPTPPRPKGPIADMVASKAGEGYAVLGFGLVLLMVASTRPA